jgi:hypothetical protein
LHLFYNEHNFLIGKDGSVCFFCGTGVWTQGLVLAR